MSRHATGLGPSPTYYTGVALASGSDDDAMRRLMESAVSIADLQRAGVESLADTQAHETRVLVDDDGNPQHGKRGGVKLQSDGLALAWNRVRRELAHDTKLAPLFRAASVDLDNMPDDATPDDVRRTAAMQRHARVILRKLGAAFRERLQDGCVFAHHAGGGRYVIAYPESMRDDAMLHAASVRDVDSESMRYAIESAMVDRRSIESAS